MPALGLVGGPRPVFVTEPPPAARGSTPSAVRCVPGRDLPESHQAWRGGRSVQPYQKPHQQRARQPARTGPVSIPRRPRPVFGGLHLRLTARKSRRNFICCA